MAAKRGTTRRGFISMAGAALAAPTLLGARAAGAVELATVETEHGILQGLRDHVAVSFKGVQYAAPTGGINRFMGP